MQITEDNLREMFVAPGHVTEELLKHVLALSLREGLPPEQIIVREGLVSDQNLGKTIADYFEYRFVDLHNIEISDTCLEHLPEIVASSQRAVIFEEDAETVRLATEFPDNYALCKLLEKKTGKSVLMFYATHASLNEALASYLGDYSDRLEELAKKSLDHSDDGEVITFVNLLLEYAHESSASDIHIEPREQIVVVRFRVDGILHEAVRYPHELHEKVVFRIKILSRLQTDEHAAPQDGRFDFSYSESVFDVRVSVLPIRDGENVVLRLLAASRRQFTLENLGLGDKHYQMVTASTGKPHGMILAVGPTGSGKTTVLYSILERLNTPDVNIMTIEDPIEYDIAGVQQTQVNQKKNLLFSTGLRSIVRQDPDIILVGEIRDEETADIAVNAALTGHLLLSTLHTNDAATTFPRLMEMGVEPFLIASSVNLIVALRLVRKICDRCKESYLMDEKEISFVRLHDNVVKYIEAIRGNEPFETLRLYRGAGCKVCAHSGYAGRIGIFEVLEIDDAIRLLVTKQASADVIAEKARANGMTTLLEDGVRKALGGITTLEEVIKSAHM